MPKFKQKHVSVTAAALLLFSGLMTADGFDHHDAEEQADFTGMTAQGLVMADRYVKINRSKHGHYITYAQINDAKVIALIDTGATDIALSYEDAERAGLHPFRLKFDKRVYTANGIAKVAKVNLRRVIVDKIIVHDVDGVVMPKGAMRGVLLGMSFLNRLTSFSFDRGVLHLEE